MNPLELDQFRRELILEMHKEQDYDAIFGMGAWWRRKKAETSGAIVVFEERPDVELEDRDHNAVWG